MRTFLLILLLTSFFNLPFLKSQCAGFSGTTTLVTQGCDGNCGLITAELTGGTAPYTYRLYHNNAPFTGAGATNDSTQICATGNYTYEVTDANGCLILTNFIFYNQAATPLSASIQSISNYNGFPVSCPSNFDACVKVNPTGGFPNPSNMGYVYDVGGGPSLNDTICNLGTGTYSITVSDFLGCTTTSLINLTAPSVSINTPLTICENAATSINCQINSNSGPYTYLWDGGETSSIVFRGSGVVSVTVTDVNGCAMEATDTITAIPLLDSMIISQNIDPFWAIVRMQIPLFLMYLSFMVRQLLRELSMV